MPLLHVYWEKTLFGLLYQTPKAALFQKTLREWNHVNKPLVYGELFYATTIGELGSFSYNYNPVSQVVRSHISLWTGEEEKLEYGLDVRRQLTSFHYRLHHGDRVLSWACITSHTKQHLAAKCDDHILVANVSATE
jgi:hypothetical protein